MPDRSPMAPIGPVLSVARGTRSPPVPSAIADRVVRQIDDRIAAVL